MQRMQVGHAGQGGQPLVPLGVVLHRAGAKRIEIRVDGHVALGEIDEMTDKVNLGHFRKRRRRVFRSLMRRAEP